jgi:hypothetical protein
MSDPSGKALLALACITLSMLISQVNAQPTPIAIPEISYNPTLDQLMSDWHLTQQMTVLDMKENSNAPVAAKVAIGYDANKMDFILDYTSQTSPTVPSAFVNIAVDKINEASRTPTNETFLIICVWVPSSNQRSATWYTGYSSGGFSGFNHSINLPSGVAWTSTFNKTYLNQEQDHVAFAVQIPDSIMGSGNAEGKYGIYLAMGLDNATQVPGYPADSEYFSPQTYGSFTTQQPIPEFTSATELLAGVAILLVAAFLKVKRKQVS